LFLFSLCEYIIYLIVPLCTLYICKIVFCFQQQENCENRNDPDLVQAFLKKWWVESDFIAPNLPLSLRLKGSGCHYNSIYNNEGRTYGLRLRELQRTITYGIDYYTRVITVFTAFRLLTDFVCLYTYEFRLSLCQIVWSSVILLLPLFSYIISSHDVNYRTPNNLTKGKSKLISI
jgi:hypothetical protein